jgi:hypothetical protein
LARLEQFGNFTRRQNVAKKSDDPFFGLLARIFNKSKPAAFPDFTAKRAV